MAAESINTQSPLKKPPSGFFTTKVLRSLRNNITAYLFLFPAISIVFTFGIFPILFAFYVSLYKWRIKQNSYLGLDNYIGTMGDVGYVVLFIIALTLAGVGVWKAIAAIKSAQKYGWPAWVPLIYALPGAAIVYGLVQLLLKAVTFFAWEEAIESGEAERLGSIGLGLGAILLGILLNALFRQYKGMYTPSKKPGLLPEFTIPAITVIATLGIAYKLSDFTYTALRTSERYGLAVTRIKFLMVALLLLIAGYYIWTWGARQHSNLKFVGSVVGAALLIGGALHLINIWSAVSKDADPDFYQSLSVTIWYSLGTVPFQLGISMTLAYLLYQNIKGKSIFRIIFFIPYIAPAVATAGIYQAMFNLRGSSVANQILSKIIGVVGQDEIALKWLKESGSAVAVLGQAFGIESAANWDWGPSLALVVIILYNIWVYTGYDTVIFLAGLGNISNSLYEAARIDGASQWQLFRHITVPLLSPTTYFLSVISVIGTFKAFNHIFVLRDAAAKGTVDAASVHFFVTFQRAQRFGYATSMAVVLFVIILVLYLIQNRIAEKSVHYD